MTIESQTSAAVEPAVPAATTAAAQDAAAAPASAPDPAAAAAESALPTRESRMQALVKASQAIRDKEIADNNESVIDTSSAGAADATTPPATPLTPAASPSPAPSQSPFFERDGKRFAKINVYGQAREVSEEELVRIVQKDVAADVRMQRAAEREHQLTLREQQLRAAAVAPPAAPAPAPAVSEEAEEAVRTALELALDGSPAEGAKALTKLLQQGRQPATPDKSVIEQTVAETLQRNEAARQEEAYATELVKAANVFAEEFKELAGNEQLTGFVDRETERIQALEPTLSPTEIVRKAGRNVMELLSPKAPPEDPRIALKRGLAQPVVGAQTAAPLGPKAPPPVTAASVLKAMRAGRGQPVP